ncbi:MULTISPECIES: hypothetical protein [Salinibaculum]|uniref:hypothetical protein n=1 Tax=Salinibaculum TaxID=2732368 RepID=UPI0030D23B52
MTESEPADSFDLPEHCVHDAVVIYENPNPYQPPYRATPFDYVGDDERGNGYFEEPEEYIITEAYREAVAERASMDIDDVRLRQPPTPDPEDVEPL